LALSVYILTYKGAVEYRPKLAKEQKKKKRKEKKLLRTTIQGRDIVQAPGGEKLKMVYL